MSALALRDIKEGEELTISCTPPFSPRPYLPLPPISPYKPLTSNPLHQLLTSIVSDSEFGLNSQERKDAMLSRWGFLCTCSLCTASAEATKKSDERRELIKELRDAALDHVMKREFRKAIAKQADMIAVMEEEQMLSPMGEYWQIQARLYNTIGDYANAKKHAEMALEDLEVYGGRDYEEDVMEMKRLIAYVEKKGA